MPSHEFARAKTCPRRASARPRSSGWSIQTHWVDSAALFLAEVDDSIVVRARARRVTSRQVSRLIGARASVLPFEQRAAQSTAQEPRLVEDVGRAEPVLVELAAAQEVERRKPVDRGKPDGFVVEDG